jgi:hypothetical protein
MVGEWHARKDVTPEAPRRPDDRIVVLADPGLAVLTPPAYRALLLGSAGAPPAGTGDGGAAGDDPDGGAATRAGAGPTIYGLEIPPGLSAVIGIDDGPFLDLEAQFAGEGPARHWELEWPALQRRLRTHPYAILSGFSTLVGRATLTREENVIHFHLTLTRDETLRLLALAQQLLANRGF